MTRHATLSSWQAARQSYSLFLGALPRFSLMLLKMLAAFILANGLVLTFFYEPPTAGAPGASYGTNLDLLALLLMAPFLAACGRLALLGTGAGEAYFVKVFQGRETRFLVTMLAALVGGLAPAGLAAAIDKRPAFGAAFKLGGRIVWRACAATALVSGPFLVLNVILGAAAFVWAEGDPTRLFDKRFLFCVETVSNMLQALHLGLTTMACALIAKGAIPEIFAGDPPTQAAPGQTP